MKKTYEYIIIEPFSKSFYFLAPLLRTYYSEIYPIKSYCYTNLFPEYSIDNGYLVIEYKIKKELSSEEIIRLKTEKDVENLIIKQDKCYILYDLKNEFINELDSFLEGEYTHLSDNQKNMVLKFFGEKEIYNSTKYDISHIKDKRIIALIDQNKFKDEIIEELSDYYNTDASTFSELENWIKKFDKNIETLQ